MELPRRLTFDLPDWLWTECDLERPRSSDEERMQLALELARRNVEHGGGPFGAVVYEAGSGKLVAPGVNLVVPLSCSLLHAEVVALAFGQARLRNFTFAGGSYELFTTADPCVQCLGACHWAGLSRLVCGAPLDAAEAAGFDEGPRTADWQEQLASRGTSVRTGVGASQATAILQDYAARGLIRYNARAAAPQ